MSRTFLIKRSKNKIKKWVVKEELPPLSLTNEKEEENVFKRKRGRPPVNKPIKKRYSKAVYFGQTGYRDYPSMCEEIEYEDDKDEKERLITEAEYIKHIYLKRHAKNEDWNDLSKAGTWSRYISWNLPTLEESVKDMEHKFNIQIILDQTEHSSDFLGEKGKKDE